jgi:anti-sigma factor RsiW
MKCEWVQQNILLYVYEELPDDARDEVEQHVSRCTDCAADLASTRELRAKLSALPVEDPSPNLLASSRVRLQNSLETNEISAVTQEALGKMRVQLARIQPQLQRANRELREQQDQIRKKVREQVEAFRSGAYI